MNKSVYILIALFTLCISSCSDENDIFDSSSARRMNAMLQECNEILTGAENGWIFEYYPEDSKYGGFQLYMTFSKEGEVKVTAESPILESPGEQVTSMYQVKADMGPVLSFDTYNRILHQFSDPDPDGLGYEGDYEFVILTINKEGIELRGKKTGVKMQMIPLPAGTTWESYSNRLNKMIQAFPGFTMRLNIDGKVIDMEESDEIGRYQTFKLPAKTNSSAEGTAFIYTPDGIKFKSPDTKCRINHTGTRTTKTVKRIQQRDQVPQREFRLPFGSHRPKGGECQNRKRTDRCPRRTIRLREEYLCRSPASFL